MKDLILRGIGVVLGGKSVQGKPDKSGAAVKLEVLGAGSPGPHDSSIRHDDYIHGKLADTYEKWAGLLKALRKFPPDLIRERRQPRIQARTEINP